VPGAAVACEVMRWRDQSPGLWALRLLGCGVTGPPFWLVALVGPNLFMSGIVVMT